MRQRTEMRMCHPPRWLLILLVLGITSPLSAQQQTVSELQQAAESGDTNAQLKLADLYDKGSNVPQNFRTAAKWLRAAAEQGNAEAQHWLGRYLRSGLGLKRDNTQAFQWLAQAAEAGKPEYLYDLGQMYEQGIGVTQDYAQAVELYTRASDAGLAEATVNLGVLYQNGNGVSQDFTKAHAFYLGPANAGHARAQNNLGLLYTRGDGVPQNYEVAAEWFKKAADAGLATAMTNLGVMYENGFGLKQSDQEAAILYRRAGQNKDQSFDAFVQRIGFVDDPRLVLPDVSPLTLQTQQKAAEQGDPVAQFLLAYIMVSGSEAGRNYQQAAIWFQNAADAGIAAAKANLGLLYFRGLGVPQDFITGYMWLTLAAAGNQSELATLRDAFTQKMTSGQINEAQSMANDRWTAQ